MQDNFLCVPFVLSIFYHFPPNKWLLWSMEPQKPVYITVTRGVVLLNIS